MEKIINKEAVAEHSIPDRTLIRDKAGRMTPLSLANVAPADITSSKPGVVPIGYYRGGVAFWDLDLAVKQPLVNAELAHILGILDGREEGYDLKTLTTVVGATSPIGTVLTGTLTVPAGQVWYLNAVRTTLNTTGAANGLVGNWRCSLWTDRATVPSASGQSFHPAAGLVRAAGGSTVFLDEFGQIATLWVVTNKPSMLRLPAGTVITFTMTTTTAQVDVAAASTLELFGFIGKPLVA